MRKSLPIAAFFSTFLIFGATASAVDIENADQETYRVTIVAGGESETFSLNGASKEENVCEERCTLQVEGVGSIEAGEEDVVVIQNGVLSKRRKTL